MAEEIRSGSRGSDRYRNLRALLDLFEYALLGASLLGLLVAVVQMMFDVPHWEWLRHTPVSMWGVTATLRTVFERVRERNTTLKRLTRHEWRYLLVTVARQGLFGIPALLLPPRERHDWLCGVREAFDYRGDVGMSGWAVAGSYIAAFPHTLVAMWVDLLAGKAPVLNLDEQPAPRRPLHRIRRWLREWWIALLAACLVEPVMYLIGYWLHSHGLVWPWEFWFPMD